MIELFSRGDLREFLAHLVANCKGILERMPEDEVLARSTDDIVAELSEAARVEPLMIEADPIDGGVTETKVDMYERFTERHYQAAGLKIHAVFEYSGNSELFRYRPSTWSSRRHLAEVSDNTITVQTEQQGSTPNPAATKQAIEREIGGIRQMAEYVAADVGVHNAALDSQLRSLVERRKNFLQDRRELAGALGFPLKKRTDAPARVPMQRKAMGVQRSKQVSPRAPYRDEPALNESQYEDAISVISSALLAMERTPSVVAGMDEEALRDYILVPLNGTFEGSATGETFVNGKTDILVRVEDRHVFVGECKWWRGQKALGSAIDQLLGYLPWRDEKAALIVFIDNKDASAVFDKVENGVKEHDAFKRAGKSSADKTKRRNFILGHPEDREREIQLAVLFAVLPKNEGGR